MNKEQASVLAETSWLEDHLNDPNVRVIEIEGLFIPYNFSGYIPGSVVLNWRKDFWRPENRDFLRKDQFEALMSRIGVSNNTTVILSSLRKQFSTYAFWLLKYYGHEDARVLNGGLAKWMGENRPLVAQPTNRTFASVKYQAKDRNESMRAMRDYVLDHLGKSDVAIVDVRSPQEYHGELFAPPGTPQEGAYCKGRIPGAVGIHFEENVQPDQTFKSPEELRKIYDAKGLTPQKEIIVYCRTGHRASFAWFTLTYLLGYPRVRVYDGSWTEWGNLVSAPIEI